MFNTSVNLNKGVSMNNLVEIEKLRKIAGIVREVLAVSEFPLGGALTYQQWNVIHALFKGELTAGELANKAGILGPSLSRIIRDLSKLGIARSVRKVRDKRTLCVRLTKEGEELYRGLYRKVGSGMRLTAADKDHLNSIIGG